MARPRVSRCVGRRVVITTHGGKIFGAGGTTTLAAVSEGVAVLSQGKYAYRTAVPVAAIKMIRVIREGR